MIEPRRQIEYFIRYAGDNLEVWQSIIGQQIIHYMAGPGTITGVSINGDIKVRFHVRQAPKTFPLREFTRVFTSITLPDHIQRALEACCWNFETEDLLHQLRHVALQSPIDEAISDAFQKIYRQLMEMRI